MKKLLLIPLFIIVIGAMVLAGCGPSATPTSSPTPTATQPTATQPTATQPTATQPTATQPTATAPTHVPYGTIHVASGDFANESFDPIENESVWGFAIYDTLLTFGPTGVILPNVAESFEFADNGTWTFHIRHGIKFTNGEDLTADDVKFTIDRFGDTSISRNPWSQYISAGYNKIECVVDDPYTVRFIAARPEIHQGIAFAWMRVFPKDYFESVGQDEFRKHPIGSGPWKVAEFVPETRILFEANTNHWERVPYYEFVEEIQVPEQSTRVAMLKEGDVDIAFPIDYDRLAELEAVGYRMEALGFPMISDINFQGTWMAGAGAAGDIRIREAVSLAIDREELCATWYQGFAVPGGQFFMHRGSWGWSDELIPESNLAKAQALMAEAGYPDAFDDPVIHIFCQATAQDYMLVVLGYLEAAGFQTELKIIDTGAFWGALFARPAEGAWNVGWAWPWTSGSFFNCTYHSANLYTSRGIHGTSNDVLATELYDAYLAETDMVQAEQLWMEFQQYVKTLYLDIGIAEIEPKLPVGPNLGEFSERNWWGLQEAYCGIKHPGQ